MHCIRYFIPNTQRTPTLPISLTITLQPQQVPGFLLILIVPFIGGMMLLPIH